MNEAIWVYLGIGALTGIGMAILFAAENAKLPLLARLSGAVTVWALVTATWPLWLMALMLGKLRR